MHIEALRHGNIMIDIYSIDIETLYKSTTLSPHMEDYIEAIAVLADTNKVVRVKDIAAILKIKMPSVTSALNKLKEMDLIEYEKYGYIELTDAGDIIAKRVMSRHMCLKEFFIKVLQLPAHAAEQEACKIEHHISAETCKRIHRLLIYFRSEEAADKEWTRTLTQILISE